MRMITWEMFDERGTHWDNRLWSKGDKKEYPEGYPVPTLYFRPISERVVAVAVPPVVQAPAPQSALDVNLAAMNAAQETSTVTKEEKEALTATETVAAQGSETAKDEPAKDDKDAAAVASDKVAAEKARVTGKAGDDKAGGKNTPKGK